MAAEALGVPQDHFRSVTVTTLAALAGVLAGLASAVYVGDPQATTGLYVFAAFLLVQFPILQGLGVDVGEFGAKDHLYVAFMSFSMWFVTWTILLQSNVTF